MLTIALYSRSRQITSPESARMNLATLETEGSHRSYQEIKRYLCFSESTLVKDSKGRALINSNVTRGTTTAVKILPDGQLINA